MASRSFSRPQLCGLDTFPLQALSAMSKRAALGSDASRLLHSSHLREGFSHTKLSIDTLVSLNVGLMFRES